MFDLHGRVAVVTGASSGIGQASAIALAQAGAHVAGLSLGPTEGADETAAAVLAAGRDALMVEGDTSDPAQVESFAAAVEERFGQIDIWVNNAAQVQVKPFLELEEADWRRILSINLDGYWYGCRAAAQRMAPRGYGRIVNISSNTFYAPSPNMSSYVASKGGVIGLTRALALELAPHGIAVNSIAPGTIDSAMNRDIFTPAIREVFNEKIAVGRIGVGRDIASAVVYFCSEEAGYVTGQDLLVDGGMVLNGDVGISADDSSGTGSP